MVEAAIDEERLWLAKETDKKNQSKARVLVRRIRREVRKENPKWRNIKYMDALHTGLGAGWCFEATLSVKNYWVRRFVDREEWEAKAWMDVPELFEAFDEGRV